LRINFLSFDDKFDFSHTKDILVNNQYLTTNHTRTHLPTSFAMNNQQELLGGAVWGDLTDSERGIYMNFYARTVNNIRVQPGNNDVIWPRRIYTPTEAQINAVSDTGDDLVRTINYRLNDDQYNAIQIWVREHGSNYQRGRLSPPQIWHAGL